MADWYGVPFLRLLFSAERFSELAIFFGSFDLNTPDCRSSASLVSITWCDHFFGAVFLADFFRVELLCAVAGFFGVVLFRAVPDFFFAVVARFFFAAVAILMFPQPMQAGYHPLPFQKPDDGC